MAQRTGRQPYPSIDDIQRQWGQRIRAEREARHLTIEKVAETLGVRHSTVSRWETYRSNVPESAKVELCGIFGLHPHDVFAFPEQTPPAPKERPARKVAA